MEHTHVALHYNEKQGTVYEDDRWFKHAVSKSHYKMTKAAIVRMLQHTTYASCLELGPGAGTWSRLLMEHAPEADFMAVDISEAMLEMTEKNIADLSGTIEFVCSDFLEFSTTKQFDFFFSARAIEYINDKAAAMKNVASFLGPDGRGAIITKNPRYFGDKLFGRRVRGFHKGQVTAGTLTSVLAEAGLQVTRVRPVTSTVPLLRSSIANTIAHSVLRHFWFAPLHRIFTESYIVEFQKS